LNLNAWLDYIMSLHPTEIELGLDRVAKVATNLALSKPAPLVVLVAGTNGKGSCVACIEAILQETGLKTASYTSPHLHQYNERIRVESEMVTDEHLCKAFTEVEQSRQGTTLSYFEFGTLAALWLIQRSDVDVAILEVGLGGRLDAVNIVDPDVSVITSIAIEHSAWLGNSVEEIGREKAGILRRNIPAVYGDKAPPGSIVKIASELNTRLYIQDIDFDYVLNGPSSNWSWRGISVNNENLEYRNLPVPTIDLRNASTALQAIAQLPVEVFSQSVVRAFAKVQLAGRFELCRDQNTGIQVILDVAHNPAAATFLARKLKANNHSAKAKRRIIAVIAVMADKDVDGMYQALESSVDFWYIAEVEETRCMPVAELGNRLRNCNQALSIKEFEQVSNAYQVACNEAETGDIVLVIGSFYTVGIVRNLTDASSHRIDAT
jgi:dihydrofolate synthase/folylpolyglutamate synthase